MWQVSRTELTQYDGKYAAVWLDDSSRLFTMGETLMAVGQFIAAREAFFLSSLSAHLARGDLPDARQCDWITKGGCVGPCTVTGPVV